MAEPDEMCDTCSTPLADHTFAELLHHLYADQGMTKGAAKATVERIVERLS